MLCAHFIVTAITHKEFHEFVGKIFMNDLHQSISLEFDSHQIMCILDQPVSSHLLTILVFDSSEHGY